MRARLVLAVLLACAGGARGGRAQQATPAPAAAAASAVAASVGVMSAVEMSAAAATPFAGVVLEDHEQRKWDLGLLAGHPVLVVVADRAASDASVEWGRGIAAARPQSVAAWIAPGKVAVVSVADLRVVPGFARGTARWIIAQMVGEQGAGGPPLLLDWDGAVASRIGARDGVPNVRLFGTDGTLLLRDEGDATPQRIARLVAAIDGLVPPGASPAELVPMAESVPSAREGPSATAVPAAAPPPPSPGAAEGR